MSLQGPSEGLGAGEQSLLKLDEGEVRPFPEAG